MVLQTAPLQPDTLWTRVRIRPGLSLQAQVEVVRVQEAGAHAVDDPLTHGQRPPVQDPQRGLLVQSQVLMGGSTVGIGFKFFQNKVLSFYTFYFRPATGWTLMSSMKAMSSL